MLSSGKLFGSSTTCKWQPAAMKPLNHQSDPVQSYLNEIGRYPLLTKAQEVMLGTQVQAWMAIADKERDTYTPEELRIEKLGKKARDKIVNCNLRLVVSVARKYITRSRALDFMDLIQEGNKGLLRAVEKFDPTRGYAISTYAYWWIRQSIQRAIQTHGLIIKLPSNALASIFAIETTAEALAKEYGRNATAEEVAEHLGIEVAQVESLYSAPRSSVSLDQRCNDGNGTSSIIDMIADPNSSNSIEDAERRINIDAAYNAISKYLDPLSRYIVLERHKEKPTPWRELASQVNMSPSKLQAMEKKALQRCALMIHIREQLGE